MDKKLYSITQIRIITALFSTLAGSVLVFKNLRKMGKSKQALWVLSGGIIYTLLLVMIFTAPIPALDNLPSTTHIGLNIIMALVVSLIMQRLDTDKEIEQQEEKASNWKAFFNGIGFLLIVVTFTFTFSLFQPPFPGEKYQLDEVGNVVYYNDDNYNEKDAKEVGDFLKAYQIFADDFGADAYLHHTGDYKTLTIVSELDVLNDKEAIEYIKSLVPPLRNHFDSPFLIRLYAYKLNGIEERLIGLKMECNKGALK